MKLERLPILALVLVALWIGYPTAGARGAEEPAEQDFSWAPNHSQLLESVDETRHEVRSPAVLDSAVSGEPRLVWSEEIHHPGATFIAPHFEALSVPPGAQVIVRSTGGERLWRYPDPSQGLADGPGFWGSRIPGDTAVVELHSRTPVPAGAVVIDRYAYGMIEDAVAGAVSSPVATSVAGASCNGTPGQWQGCRGTGCHVCSELISGFPLYLRNNPECFANSHCGGLRFTCNAKCPAPDSADACNGTAGQWQGCRGTGCHVCEELVQNYPCYFQNHPFCIPNDNCQGRYFTCNENCPAPGPADQC